MESFEDDEIDVNQKSRFALEKVANIVGKGEHAVYQHFLLFPQCFQEPSLLGIGKSQVCVVKS